MFVWRPSGRVLMRLQIAALLRSGARKYERVYDRFPYICAGLMIGSKAAVSDITAQLYDAPDSTNLDIGRCLKFTAFTALYVGSFQHFVYNVLYTRLFGPGTGAVIALQKSLVDNFIHAPFLYFPAYYSRSL